MKKSTPSFQEMISARGGGGATASGKKGGAHAIPKTMPKGMPKCVKDSDKDGN